MEYGRHNPLSRGLHHISFDFSLFSLVVLLYYEYSTQFRELSFVLFVVGSSPLPFSKPSPVNPGSSQSVLAISDPICAARVSPLASVWWLPTWCFCSMLSFSVKSATLPSVWRVQAWRHPQACWSLRPCCLTDTP